jgi:hypothetical protein
VRAEHTIVGEGDRWVDVYVYLDGNVGDCFLVDDLRLFRWP